MSDPRHPSTFDAPITRRGSGDNPVWPQGVDVDELLRQRDALRVRVQELEEQNEQLAKDLADSVGAYRQQVKELQEALQELIQGGEHEGPCERAYDDEGCMLHQYAYAGRVGRARAVLAAVPVEEETATSGRAPRAR